MFPLLQLVSFTFIRTCFLILPKKETIMTTSKQSHAVKYKDHLKGCELYHGYLQNLNVSIIPFLFHKLFGQRLCLNEVGTKNE